MLYMGLWNQADEHGRCNGDPEWIRGRVFPYETDIRADECARLLDELARGEWVQKYTVDGDPFLFLPKLGRHQRLEGEKVPSRFPGPEEADPEQPPDQPTQIDPDGSAPDADKSEPGADKLSLLYVAGSREHVYAHPPGGRARTIKPGSDGDPDWRRFWDAFPRKVGKKRAREAWAKAMKAGHDPAKIIAGAERYAEEMTRQRAPADKIKHPDGWLNGERWTDETGTPSNDYSGGSGGAWWNN